MIERFNSGSCSAMPRHAAPRCWHALAVGALALACAAAPLAQAQTQGDPPGRVGRISLIDGQVALRAGGAESGAARLNWPVTSGDAIETGPAAHAEVRIGSTAVSIDSGSTLQFERIDDRAIGMRLDRGRAAVRVRDPEAAPHVSVVTAQGRVQLMRPGLLRVDAGIEPAATALTLIEGGARFAGADGATTLLLQPGREAVASGSAALSTRTTVAQQDAFDEWLTEREATVQAPRNSFVSAEMTGAEALDAYGSWSTSDEYGPIWTPSFAATDWAPYRDGRWAWISPWGWTWVDNAPWGFAPFHYGRWASIGGRWSWTPGMFEPRPVYAPALVAWIGAPGWRVSVADGESIAWFPLAPREPFYPGYRAGIDYLHRINVPYVRNLDVTQVNSVHYINRSNLQAVTVVPRAALGERRSMAGATLPLHDARQLAALPAGVAPSRRSPEAALHPRAEQPRLHAAAPDMAPARPRPQMEPPQRTEPRHETPAREVRREDIAREPQHQQREHGESERGAEHASRSEERREH